MVLPREKKRESKRQAGKNRGRSLAQTKERGGPSLSQEGGRRGGQKESLEDLTSGGREDVGVHGLAPSAPEGQSTLLSVVEKKGRGKKKKSCLLASGLIPARTGAERAFRLVKRRKSPAKLFSMRYWERNDFHLAPRQGINGPR